LKCVLFCSFYNFCVFLIFESNLCIMPQKFNIHHPDDRFFKSAMSDPEVAKSYLQHFYPELAQVADFSSLRLENSRGIRSNLKQFDADVIYRCRFKGEKKDHYFYFYLLFEHKSQPDKYIAVQVGFYIMELMYRMIKEDNRRLEPVLPLVFYNGKEEWVPKTLAALFEGHPHRPMLEPYIPDFCFLFQDASRLSSEELLRLELSYFRSVLMAMAFRYRQGLIFKHIQAIFEGVAGKEEIHSITTYILGIAERSEDTFYEAIQNTELTIKPEVMSTLEQILERGRKEGRNEGLDKGMYKKSIFNLLKTVLRFPEWPATELAEFTDLEIDTIHLFLHVRSQGDVAALRKCVLQKLLADIPVSSDEKQQLHLVPYPNIV